MKTCLMCFMVFLAPAAANAALVYHLDPGSEITIFETGATEALTGTFTWEVEADLGDLIVMLPTGLLLDSDSVSITLDPDGGYGTSVFLENDPDRCLGDICETFFGALVNISGIASVDASAEFGFSSSGNGGYDGSALAPDRVFYDQLFLIPESGGGAAVRLQFSATLAAVPLPTPLLLLASGLLGLVATGRRPAAR